MQRDGFETRIFLLLPGSPTTRIRAYVPRTNDVNSPILTADQCIPAAPRFGGSTHGWLPMHTFGNSQAWVRFMAAGAYPSGNSLLRAAFCFAAAGSLAATGHSEYSASIIYAVGITEGRTLLYCHPNRTQWIQEGMKIFEQTRRVKTSSPDSEPTLTVRNPAGHTQKSLSGLSVRYFGHGG